VLQTAARSQQLCLEQSGWSNPREWQCRPFSSIVECPRWHLPQNVSGRTNGVRSVSFSRMALLASGSRCPPAALGLAARNLLKARDTQVGSGQWHFIRMVKWLQVAVVIKPCGSGMCEMVSAAKHCRDMSLVCSLSFSPNGQMLSGSSDQTVRLGCARWHLPQNLTGHTGGVWAVAFAQMDTPLRVAAVIKPCGYGMCKMAPPEPPKDIRVGFWQSRLAQMDTPLRVAAMIKPCGYGMCKTERAGNVTPVGLRSVAFSLMVVSSQ